MKMRRQIEFIKNRLLFFSSSAQYFLVGEIFFLLKSTTNELISRKISYFQMLFAVNVFCLITHDSFLKKPTPFFLRFMK